jgi:glycerophosphoryl diester phosphodiesterase
VAITAPVDAQSHCPGGQLPAYAHNDYENARPLTGAISLGFRGVEADIFLVDGVLRVGHDKKSARNNESLELLYLRPLQQLVAQCGHLGEHGTPFLFSLELKEQSAQAYDSLLSVLGRYESLLGATRSIDGQTPRLTIVLVGWHPTGLTDNAAVDSMLSWQHAVTRDPTSRVPDKRVRLLSIDYGKTMGRWWVTSASRQRWLAAIRAAKTAAPDRLVRAHNVPVNARVYTELFDAGVDIIGTKQLQASAAVLAAMRPR